MGIVENNPEETEVEAQQWKTHFCEATLEEIEVAREMESAKENKHNSQTKAKWKNGTKK